MTEIESGEKNDQECDEKEINSINLQFCNKKSIELFGFGPVGAETTAEEKKLAANLMNKPQFIHLSDRTEDNMYDQDNASVAQNAKILRSMSELQTNCDLRDIQE